MSHLMLSRHVFWYYRRVYLTPRKRREIRIFLRTHSKRDALIRVEKYLTSQPFHCVPQSIPAHTPSAAATSFQQPQQKKPFKSLKSELDKYTSAKAGSVGEREILTINREQVRYACTISGYCLRSEEKSQREIWLCS